MVYRVYVEKRPGLTAEADALASDIRTLLGIASLERLRLLNRYDVENITPELFDYSVKTIDRILDHGAVQVQTLTVSGICKNIANSGFLCNRVITTGSTSSEADKHCKCQSAHNNHGNHLFHVHILLKLRPL